MKKAAALLFALVLLLALCPVSAVAAGTSSSGTYMYSPEDQLDFAMTFPLSDWTFQYESTSGQYVLQSADKSSSVDQIRISAETLPAGTSPEFISMSLSFLKLEDFASMFDSSGLNSSFTSLEPFDVNGCGGVYLSGEGVILIITAKMDLVMWAAGTHLYSAVLLSTVGTYDTMKAAFVSMLSTFQLASQASGQASAAPASAAPSGYLTAIPTVPEVYTYNYTLDQTSLQSAVVVDDDSVRITVDDLEYNSYGGAYLNLTVENKASQRLKISNDFLIINGYSVGGSLYMDVAAGKTSSDSILIGSSNLADAGITTIADIDVNFTITTDDYLRRYTTDTIHLRTDAPADFVQPVDQTGLLVYEGKGIRVIARCLETSSYSSELILLVRNDSDEYYYMEAVKVLVNGIEPDESNKFWTFDGLPAHSWSVCDICMSSDKLTALGITDINAISLQLELHSYGTYFETFTTDLVEIPVQR